MMTRVGGSSAAATRIGWLRLAVGLVLAVGPGAVVRLASGGEPWTLGKRASAATLELDD
jgi:hypothetical protein